MEHETATIITDGIPQDYIVIDLGDGAFKSFPADESNPEYVAFLEAITPAPKTTAKSE